MAKYAWDVRTVAAIAMAESGCSPRNHNYHDHHRTCEGSWNILQVGCVHYSKGEDINDVDLNIKKAYEVYLEAGKSFSPWTTYTSKAYKKYL